MEALTFSLRYMQFHPLAYIVKLNIEMSMAELIVKIAKGCSKQKYQGADDFENYNSNTITMQTTRSSNSNTITTQTTRSFDRSTISNHHGKKSRYSKYGSVKAGPNYQMQESGNRFDENTHPNGGIYTTREIRVEFGKAPELPNNGDTVGYENT